MLHLLTSACGTTRKCLRARITSAYWRDADPAQTSRLTDRCQFDMLRANLGWWGRIRFDQ